MLLHWQKSVLQETTLSDSDEGEKEEQYDENGEPTVGYTAHDEYTLYVLWPAGL